MQYFPYPWGSQRTSISVCPPSPHSCSLGEPWFGVSQASAQACTGACFYQSKQMEKERERVIDGALCPAGTLRSLATGTYLQISFLLLCFTPQRFTSLITVCQYNILSTTLCLSLHTLVIAALLIRLLQSFRPHRVQIDTTPSLQANIS